MAGRARTYPIRYTAPLPLMRSDLPRTRRLWGWALAIGFGNTTLTQVGISVGTERAGAAVAAVPDLDIPGITAAQFLAGGVPLIPLVLFTGRSTEWSRASLDAQLAFLIIGGQVLVYLGFNAALSRWPSTRVYAWTFLVPVVAAVTDAILGKLPGLGSTIGIVIVILGVAIVDHPRAERSAADGPTPHSA